MPWLEKHCSDWPAQLSSDPQNHERLPSAPRRSLRCPRRSPSRSDFPSPRSYSSLCRRTVQKQNNPPQNNSNTNEKKKNNTDTFGKSPNQFFYSTLCRLIRISLFSANITGDIYFSLILCFRIIIKLRQRYCCFDRQHRHSPWLDTT